MSSKDKPAEDWGSWEQAEEWRRQSFRDRTPEQRLRWLKSALRMAYESGAIQPPAKDHD